MKEVKVANLDKADMQMMKEKEDMAEELRLLEAQYISRHAALWWEWKRKYTLPPGVRHYIKGKAIYRQDRITV